MANQEHVDLLLNGETTTSMNAAPSGVVIFDFSGARLPEHVFDDLALFSPIFSGANLCATEFRNCTLIAADFSRCSLTGAKFVSCCLLNAKFCESNLEGAKFTNCNMIGVDLSDAVIDGAKFKGVNLNRAKVDKLVVVTEFADSTVIARSRPRDGRWHSAVIRIVGVPFFEDAYNQTLTMAKAHHGDRTWFSRLRPALAYLSWAGMAITIKFYLGMPMRLLQFATWPLVRRVGELQLLTRLSYLALVFVPILAAVWPIVALENRARH